MTESAPGIIFSGSAFFLCSRSPNEWFSWKQSHLRLREEEEEPELCHRVMVQAESTRQERSHHSEGAGETAVWSEAEGKNIWCNQNIVAEQTGSRAEQKQEVRKVQESDTTQNLTLAIFANWYPLGNKQNKTVKFTSINPKMFWDCFVG